MGEKKIKKQTYTSPMQLPRVILPLKRVDTRKTNMAERPRAAPSARAPTWGFFFIFFFF
jgi:hypothetical protein